MEGATLGLEADGLAGALDLGGECGDGRLGFDSSPQRSGIALFEAADAGDPKLKRWGADARQGVGDVVRDRTLDLSNEA